MPIVLLNTQKWRGGSQYSLWPPCTANARRLDLGFGDLSPKVCVSKRRIKWTREQGYSLRSTLVPRHRGLRTDTKQCNFKERFLTVAAADCAAAGTFCSSSHEPEPRPQLHRHQTISLVRLICLSQLSATQDDRTLVQILLTPCPRAHGFGCQALRPSSVLIDEKPRVQPWTIRPLLSGRGPNGELFIQRTVVAPLRYSTSMDLVFTWYDYSVHKSSGVVSCTDQHII